MRGVGHYLKIGGLVGELGVLAACGGTNATATPPAPPVTIAATARAASPPPAAATAPASAATVTRAASPAATATRGTATAATASTATRAASPGSGTATRTGSPAAGGSAPAQAYRALQGLDSSRQSWVFTGFAVGGLSGEIRPVYDYSAGNQKVTLTAGGIQTAEAYQVGGQTYVRTPIGGVVPADPSNPLYGTAQTLFTTPKNVLDTLFPATATFTPAGAETVNGRQTTKYTGTVSLTDLGLVDPSLRGQRGTALETIWIDNAQGYIVALDASITAAAAGSTAAPARVRLDVTNVGQVPAITVPR